MNRRNRGRLISMPPPPNIKQTKIQSWLMAEGWQIGEAQSEQALWAIGAQDGAGRGLVIAQLKHPSDHLLIQVQMNFDAEILEKLKKLSDKKRTQLFWDMRLALLNIGVEFNGLDHPLNMVVMFRRIYDDGLTRDAFTHRVFQVKCAALTIHWMLMRELDETLIDLTHGFNFGEQVN